MAETKLITSLYVVTDSETMVFCCNQCGKPTVGAWVQSHKNPHKTGEKDR